MLDVVQRSPEWFACRLGKATASRVADIMAKTRSGYSSSRANYMAELLVERLTGAPTEGYTNSAMQWGIDNEPAARLAYSFMQDVDVEELGFAEHPAINDAGGSPDGLVGRDGLIEIKCMLTTNHVEQLLGAEIPGKYVCQMQFLMACTQRSWCDFVSFDPRMPEHMSIVIKRLERDDIFIAEIEHEVRTFLGELADKQDELMHRYKAAA